MEFTDLPPELLAYVLDFLGARDRVRAARTCRQLRGLNNARAYWARELCARNSLLARSLPSHVHPRSAYDDVLWPPRRMQANTGRLCAWWKARGSWTLITRLRAIRTGLLANAVGGTHTPNAEDITIAFAFPPEMTIPMVPVSILQDLMEHVGTLVITGVGLKRVPATLCMMRRLCALDLRDNRISEIPACSLYVASLRSVKLRNNRIGALVGVQWPPNLELLDIGTNRLMVVPEGLGELRGLQHLNVSGNAICSLPTWLYDFPNLVTFDVSHNRLREPVDVCAFVAGTHVTDISSLASDG